MTRSVPVGEVRPLGDRALLIGVDDPSAGRALEHALQDTLRGIDAELVCGFATVALLLRDPDVTIRSVRAAAVDALDSASVGRDAAPDGRLVTIPCVFDGADLTEVAALTGCADDEVVALLTAQSLSVAVVGFSPGFAYLDGLPGALRSVPRRAQPRPVVPAGAVALANGHAAVYPTASPGGWHLVGRTGVPLFSVTPPYAALAPGDRVRFTIAREGDPAEPTPIRLPAWTPPADARPVWEVVAPGLRAVVQDGGRRAVAASGVPAAGPADPVSLTLANRLAGNPAEAGALEITGGGTKLRSLGPCHVAAVGAAPEVRVDGSEAAADRLLPLVADQVLEVGRLRGGCRTYLAVAGGVLGPEVFGSRATDELCALGPGALGPGAHVFAGPWAPPLGDHLSEGAATCIGTDDSPLPLRVVPGPHPERFDDDALERLSDSVFVVQRDSNRVGLRLRAEEGSRWTGETRSLGELDSQGVVTGAVQVPPSGDAVVLGPDHATLGGYPVVAVVVSADLGLLGQCAPGTRVRLVPVGRDEADAAYDAQRRRLGSAVVGTYPVFAD